MYSIFIACDIYFFDRISRKQIDVGEEGASEMGETGEERREWLIDDLRFYVLFNSVETVFDDGRFTMNGCLQWSSIYG